LIKITPKSRKFNFFKIITFDSESYRYDKGTYELQKFFNADFYDGEEHYYTENIDDIIKIIMLFKKKFKKFTLFAHNIKYDIRIMHLLDYLASNMFLNIPYVLRMLDSNIYVKFASFNNAYVIQFSDSMNYFRTSLSKLGKMFNMTKEDEEEYNLNYLDWNKQLLVTGKSRVQKDTEILWHVLDKFSKMPFVHGITLASTSMNTFRRQYLKRTIYFPEEYISIALQSYHGGIVLPYKLSHNTKLYSYDINSLYPYVMKNNPYSVNFRGNRLDTKWIYDDIKNNTYNYLCKVKYTGEGYSPVFDYHDNSLIPFLENEQWITGKELLALYENNFSILIEELLEFENDYIFKDFVDDMYKKRMSATTEYEKEFYKIILNSLYGKMAQHKKHSEFMKIEDIQDEMIKYTLMNDNDTEHFYINGEIYNKYGMYVTHSKEGTVRYNPLIASEVTANARLINYEYTKIFGFDNVHYTDTDSFFTSVRKELLEGTELGKLKIEKEGLFTIYAPKDYEYYGKCNKKSCKICNGGKTNGIHYTLKGVRNPELVEGHNYINYKWSGLKHKENEDVIIEQVFQSLNRINKKMYYVNGIGREWLNKKEYNKHTAKNVKSNQFQIDFNNYGLPYLK